MDLVDRGTIESLARLDVPSEADIVHAARLAIRYRDSRLSSDLMALLLQAVTRWSLTLDELYARAQSIWSSGRAPAALQQDLEVGSGADVEA